MKKILVTGGAGFVGNHLCRRLINDGNIVFCLDNLYTGNINNIKDLLENNNFKFIEMDIMDNLDFDFENIVFDEIYNLACPASPIHYQKDSMYTLKTSIYGAVNVLNLAIKNNSKILQASTSEIYGNPLQHPQTELYWGNVNCIGPRSCYDEGKRVAETLFYEYKKKYLIDAKIVRIFNTYGPNMDINDGRVVSNMIVQALKNEDITIYGNGTQTRSFQYIDDLIEGLILMMNKDNYFGPVNLGTTFEFTINELSNIILKLIPESTSKIIYKDLPTDDPIMRKADNSLAYKELNRKPIISLEEGLIKTIEFFKSKLYNG